jgi:Zn-finger nucleic acid-binding protein
VSWYYMQSSKRQGPIDDQAMLQMVAQGALKPTDLVWRAGMEGWQQAATVPGLLEPPPLPMATPLEAKEDVLRASPAATLLPQEPSVKPIPSLALGTDIPEVAVASSATVQPIGSREPLLTSERPENVGISIGGDEENGRPKGRVAPYLVLGFLVAAAAAFPGHGGVQPLNSVVAVCALVLMAIGFSNWATRKGRSGAHALWAFLPIGGLLVLPLLKDRHKGEAEGESEAVKQCPQCGTPYRENDYGSHAVVMICPKCRGVLPRSVTVPGAPPLDKRKDAPPEGANPAEFLKNCPHCGASYRESDYNPDAREILCGKCRGVLPR